MCNIQLTYLTAPQQMQHSIKLLNITARDAALINLLNSIATDATLN